MVTQFNIIKHIKITFRLYCLNRLVIDVIEARGFIFPITSAEYHHSGEFVRGILHHYIATSAISEDDVMQVDDQVQTWVTNEFFAQLRMIHDGTSAWNPENAKQFLLEWLGEDCGNETLNAEDARALNTWKTFLEIHRESSEMDMRAANATVAQVYIAVWGKTLHNCNDEIATMTSAISSM